jgi:carbon-monoxide dehydrogenase medium subunit
MTLFYRRLPRFEYAAPKTVHGALAALKEEEGVARLLAGGTDLIPRIKKREMDAPACVVDLKGVPGLNGIAFDESVGLAIGPLATIAAVAESPVVRLRYPHLAQAATGMASPQVRNRGTIAGNICNGVPSADSAPPLLASGAVAVIKSLKGERTVPLNEFFLGPRKTVLQPDEMLLELRLPAPSPHARGVYLKLSPRHSMDLAVVGVAAVGAVQGAMCTEIKLALGAVAPTPIRAPIAEGMLLGRKITPALINEAAKNTINQCSPIDDHRASLEYRCDMVYVLAKRALTQVLMGR